jgi:glucosyltransferase
MHNLMILKGTKMKNLLSIIIPCYNEESAIPIYHQTVSKEVKKIFELGANVEFIFVDDGSKDKTLEILKELKSIDVRIHYISLSRNFGKEAAILAGLEHANGDYVVLMDADLQDPPELLIDMYEAVTSGGFDSAAARRISRAGEPKIRAFFARLFYNIINSISKTELVDGARDYRMMSRQVVDEILGMREYNRFSKGIMQWVGFDTKWFEYENIQRSAGETKWSFLQLFVYSLEGIVAFSTFPLALSAMLGVILCIISFVFICIIIIKTLIFGDPSSGWPSLIVTVLFVGGIQLFCIGILGQYLSKTYMETKRRPSYIVKSSDISKR